MIFKELESDPQSWPGGPTSLGVRAWGAIEMNNYCTPLQLPCDEPWASLARCADPSFRHPEPAAPA